MRGMRAPRRIDYFVRLSVSHGVARLVLNRPDRRNALTRELISGLLAAVEQVKNDPSARMLVLAAEGPVFCAGMDLEEMRARAADPNATAEWAEDARLFRELLVAIFKLPLPTLAVVQGPALAGGCGLVLACDLVIASSSAFFSLPEPQRGDRGRRRAGRMLVEEDDVATRDERAEHHPPKHGRASHIRDRPVRARRCRARARSPRR